MAGTGTRTPEHLAMFQRVVHLPEHRRGKYPALLVLLKRVDIEVGVSDPAHRCGCSRVGVGVGVRYHTTSQSVSGPYPMQRILSLLPLQPTPLPFSWL